MKCVPGWRTVMMGLMNSRPQNNYHLLSKCGQWLMVSCWTLLAGLGITIIISGLLLDTHLWGVSRTWGRVWKIIKNVLTVCQLLGEKNRCLSLLCREMNWPVSSVQIENHRHGVKLGRRHPQHVDTRLVVIDELTVSHREWTDQWIPLL